MGINNSKNLLNNQIFKIKIKFLASKGFLIILGL